MTRSSITGFAVYDRQPPKPALIEPITQRLAEGVNAAPNLASAFATSLAAFATSSFANEVGQTAPFTASASGASGVTVAVTDDNASTTVGVGGVLDSSANSVTFTPNYSTAMTTYVGEDSSPTPGSPSTSGAPYLARQRFLAALGTGRPSASYGFVPPTVHTFETQTTGATTITAEFANAWASHDNGQIPGGWTTTATITGATVVATNTGGKFNTTGGQAKYLSCSAGTDVVFNFNYGVSSFGCYITDAADIEGALRLHLLPDDGGAEEIVDVKTTAAPSGSLIFFGFTHKAKRYTRVRFVCDTPADTYGIDEVITADNMMTLDPTPFKGFSVLINDAGAVAGTVYTGTVLTTQGTYNFTLPLTVTEAVGGRACWVVKLNGAHKLTSVTIATSNPADMPSFDNVVFGVPYYS